MKNFGNFSINRRKNSLIKSVIKVVALLFCLIILNIFVLPIKNTFYSLSAPLQKTFWVAGESSASFFTSFFKAGFLLKENEDLKNQNQHLLSQLVFLQSIERGNQAQSDISASCQNTGYKLLMAGIMGLEGDIISINKGSNDGISEGMPVISQQNALFGKIFKVYNKFSQVQLISQQNSVVSVKVYAASAQGSGESNEIGGVVKGNGGLSAYLDLIPISSEINSGDVLLTSAIDNFFPKDLLVGEILQKSKDDQKPFQQAQIKLFFDIKASDNLFVITNYKR